ncbi:MAG: DNA mismatch repair endonuclease MutL [Clostridia bacterium]|nr:DNA mismatch repair endonuclease MutL [Clostridia bacterium]
MSELSRIRALPKELSAKIAAGEVVERPLSIIKELMENAIDAGANAIVIEIKNGGKTYIRITDNGYGIIKEDIPLAFARYATSKISSEEDLKSIHTLGFRGEALSSIAAVSIVELISKSKNISVGTKAVLEGGEIKSISDVACEQGTTIVVSDLFFNTPARKKFLKADNIESSFVIDYISKMTLAYPYIKIRLINNGTILFSTQGNGDIHRNILTVYSKQIDESLIFLEDYESNQTALLTGYIGKPDHSKKNRRFQIFFVNGRWITSKIIESALANAYEDKLFPGRYPVAFLFLKIDPLELDVNIHPNKMHVRFFNEEFIKNFITNRIKSALLREETAPNALNYISKRNQTTTLNDEAENSNPANFISSSSIKDRYEKALTFRLREDIPSEVESQEIVKNLPSAQRFMFSGLNILGSIFATYILASNDESMYIIDQHAAHERILFEKMLFNFRSEVADGQVLMLPHIIELPNYLKETGNEKVILLNKLGYHIEEFGPKEYIIKEIPSCMGLAQAEIFVHDVLDAQTEEFNFISDTQLDALISSACKAAVKANDSLSTEEMKELFMRLDQTENPFSCPHGRPTFVKLSAYDLERLFKRK